MQKIDDGYIDTLRTVIDKNAWTEDVRIVYQNAFLWRRAKNLLELDRFGEVVFAVERPNGKFIAVTSKEYPKGIFRIPTGGIHYGEDILEAVKREVMEELGLTVSVQKFIGVMRLRIWNRGKSLHFYSFLFHLKETGGNLLVDATEDEVSEVFEADAASLEGICQGLKTIREDWRDWGKFRLATTGAIAQYVKAMHGQANAEDLK